MGRPRKEDQSIESKLFSTATEDENFGGVSSDKAAKIAQTTPPVMGDVGWSDYVISLLDKDERGENGHPKTEGLRRVAGKLLGTIIVSESKLLGEPNFSNMHTAIVSHTLTFRAYSDVEGLFDRTYTAVAEASAQWLSEPFNRSPAAIASTKALGRALRDSLQLKNVIVAEESSSEINDEDAANATQVRGVVQQSNKLGIDPLKVINHTCDPAKFIFKRVEDMDRTTAINALRDLHRYSQDKDSIPHEYFTQ